jgi:hypothetical protein
MPQRDLHHEAVAQALISDGWTITHDPFYMAYGKRYGYIDLGAESVFAAERDAQKIAIEIKSFVGASVVTDLANALGQYLMYKSWLARSEPDRLLYLAIDRVIAREVFSDLSAQVLIEDYGIRLVVVDTITRRVVEWRNPPLTGRS